MARTDTLSIELQASGKDKLAEEYGKVIENIQHITLANQLKNTDLSGDPTAGSVEATRFVNVAEQEYGTARGNGKGNVLKTARVTVNIDKNKEYIEEVEEKDLRMYGVAGLIERRTRNHQNQLAVALDTEFFQTAKDAGSQFTPNVANTDVADEIEEAIQNVETIKNNYVNGVPRNMINIVMTPAYYGKLRNKINAIPNSNNLGQVANYEAGIFNNTRIYSSVFLPTGIDYLVMVDGAVAQPVMTSIYNPKKVELSDATAFGLFVYRGTKAVTEDLIFYKNSAA